MILKRNGVTRIVLLIGGWAIKIPNFTCQMNHFLLGCYSNWRERQYWKAFKGTNIQIAPSYWCSWFGLIQIQKRLLPLERDLTKEEVEYFKDITTDIKMQNFGLYEKRIVCVDYV